MSRLGCKEGSGQLTPTHASSPRGARPTSADTGESAAIVRFKSVFKRYGSFTAINNLDLAIRNGEFITLLGPSGSGKTTTLMMLAGFDEPTSGAIELDGKRIDSLPAHRREIGVVFQNYALFPHLTVAQNLAFPLSVRRVAKPEIDERVKRALDKVHLAGLAGRRPSQLSGGQQQRVALARALIFTPRLIVLDEPLGALDKNLREHMQIELKHLHRELGITMVFVTHDQSEALTMSDRVAVFNHGKIEQIDTPEALYEKPSTAFVASFIGENNLVPGSIESAADGEAKIRLERGGSVVAAVGQGAAGGQRIVVCIRPESIGPFRDGDGPDVQPFNADILETIYLGDQRRILVEAEGLGRLSLKMSSGAGHGEMVVGRRVKIGIPVGKCRALPEQAGTQLAG